MMPSKRRGCAVAVVIVMLIIVLVGSAMAWKLYPTQGTSYVFSPCPGLTVTATATTGIWNCPMEPAFTAGQIVNITGTWATGYGTVGCVPQSGQSSCAVPQFASLQDYIHSNIGGVWFVVQWKQGAEVPLTDGQVVTVSGILAGITYSSSPGTTFPVFHYGNQTVGSNLLQPQPSFEITSAVLV